MAGAAQTQLGSTFNYKELPFVATNIGNTNGTLSTPNTDVVEYQMPYDGSILGAAWRGGGTLTTGTLTLYPQINGSLCPPFSTGTLLTGVKGNQQTIDARTSNYTFKKGDYIGLVWNKTGTVEPTTLDVEAQLIVLHEGVRY